MAKKTSKKSTVNKALNKSLAKRHGLALGPDGTTRPWGDTWGSRGSSKSSGGKGGHSYSGTSHEPVK